MLDELDLVLIKVTNHLKCSYFGSLLTSRKNICFMNGFDGMQSSYFFPWIYFYIFILELCAAPIIKTRKFLDNFHKRGVITVSGLLWKSVQITFANVGVVGRHFLLWKSIPHCPRWLNFLFTLIVTRRWESTIVGDRLGYNFQIEMIPMLAMFPIRSATAWDVASTMSTLVVKIPVVLHEDLPVEIEHFPHYRHHLRFSLVITAVFDIKK